MRIVKRVATVALLLFVGVTVGVLIAQELSTAPGMASANESSVEAGVAAVSPAERPEDGTSVHRAGSVDGPEAKEADVATQHDRAVSEQEAVEPAPSICVVDAVYFHNTSRCRTCSRIEETARQLIEVEFAAEIGEGRLRWSAIDMQLDRQFVEMYDLVKPTLILIRTVDGEVASWEALDETWALIRSTPRFEMYVRDRVRDALGGCS